MSNKIFVLDANVFIEAKRRYYAFDLAPKFWESLILFARKGMIESIDRIKVELERGKDDLADWANDEFSEAFCSTNDDDVINAYTEIITWVQSESQYSDAAKAEYATSPDGWLIAYGKAKNRIIITHEVPATDAKKKIPIPNVCIKFDIEYMDTFKMLRLLGVKFT